MKLKTSALAMTATLVAGLISSAFADATVTPYEKLGFKTNLTYKVEVDGSTKTATNGLWSGSALIVADGAIEFDTDANAASTFTPTKDNSTCNATELKFNVSAAIVPKTVELTTDSNAQCGFAIKATESDGNRFMVYTGSTPAWVEAGDCELDADSYFDLTVKIDYRNSKAQYLVNGTCIGDGDGWYDLAAEKTFVDAIDFIGNGKLTSLRGDKLQVISEVVEITPSGSGTKVTLVIPEEQMEVIKTAAGTTEIGTYLNGTTDSGNLTHLDAVVLYGKTDVNTSSTDKTLVKGNVTAVPSEGNVVRVKIDGLAVKAVGGATVKHELQGSANGTDGWTKVVEGTGAEPDLQIPANSVYRYFRVVTSVEYGNK